VSGNHSTLVAALRISEDFPAILKLNTLALVFIFIIFKETFT